MVVVAYEDYLVVVCFGGHFIWVVDYLKVRE